MRTTAPVEVDVEPADGEAFSDAETGAEEEADEIGELGATCQALQAVDGRVGGGGVEPLEQGATFVDGESTRASLSLPAGLFDAFDLASRVAVDRTVDDRLRMTPTTTVRTLRRVLAEYRSLSASK